MPFTYDFKCARGHTTERRVPHGVEQVMCETCKGPALRQFAVTSPDRIRFFRERWEVNRSDVVEARPRTRWNGADLKG